MTNNVHQANCHDVKKSLKQWLDNKKAVEFIALLDEACVLESTLEKAMDHLDFLIKRDCFTIKRKKVAKLVPLWGK